MEQAKARFHLASDPGQTIAKIKIKAFYFVPFGEQPEDAKQWQSQLEESLKNTADFYTEQLNNSVNISWDIYPQAIIGEQAKIFYDTEDTNNGNPHALITVREELLRRFFTSPQNSNDADFVKVQNSEYLALAILYEGLGSSATLITSNTLLTSGIDSVSLQPGQPQAFLVSRYFFTGNSYKDYYNSIFAHEFGHILGLEDSFNLDSGETRDSDIMGSGRFRPLSITYLSQQNKIKLGITN